MGQLVAVTEQPSSTQGVVRFELNRSLTGMGHERYTSADDAGQVDAVHVYSNIVTIELARGGRPDSLAGVVRELYRYWQPGMQPPSFDDLANADEEPAGGDAPAAAGEEGSAATSAAAQRVPAHLLERSRAGRDRWKAKTGG